LAVVKWAGGLYLFCLCVKLLHSGLPKADVDTREFYGQYWKLFLNTCLVTALNPKGIVFFNA